MYMRDQSSGPPGNGWPKIASIRLAPTKGIESPTA